MSQFRELHPDIQKALCVDIGFSFIYVIGGAAIFLIGPSAYPCIDISILRVSLLLGCFAALLILSLWWHKRKGAHLAAGIAPAVAYVGGIVLGSMFFAAGLLVTINGVFDLSSPVHLIRQINKVYHGRPGMKTQKVVIGSLMGSQASAVAEVAREQGLELRVGDDVEMVVKKGALGYPWYSQKPNLVRKR